LGMLWAHSLVTMRKKTLQQKKKRIHPGPVNRSQHTKKDRRQGKVGNARNAGLRKQQKITAIDDPLGRRRGGRVARRETKEKQETKQKVQGKTSTRAVWVRKKHSRRNLGNHQMPTVGKKKNKGRMQQEAVYRPTAKVKTVELGKGWEISKRGA